jgi:hypothetical protein
MPRAFKNGERALRGMEGFIQMLHKKVLELKVCFNAA